MKIIEEVPYEITTTYEVLLLVSQSWAVYLEGEAEYDGDDDCVIDQHTVFLPNGWKIYVTLVGGENTDPWIDIEVCDSYGRHRIAGEPAFSLGFTDTYEMDNDFNVSIEVELEK